jgi:hypothetical protein
MDVTDSQRSSNGTIQGKETKFDRNQMSKVVNKHLYRYLILQRNNENKQTKLT